MDTVHYIVCGSKKRFLLILMPSPFQPVSSSSSSLHAVCSINMQLWLGFVRAYSPPVLPTCQHILHPVFCSPGVLQTNKARLLCDQEVGMSPLTIGAPSNVGTYRQIWKYENLSDMFWNLLPKLLNIVICLRVYYINSPLECHKYVQARFSFQSISVL